MSARAVVVGAGWSGEGYTRALRRAGAEVVALCGRSPGPTEAMGRKLGIGEVHLDWRAAVDRLRPDVVVVATPVRPHRDIVEFAAGRGCHVLCEKPLARNAPEARAMVEAVERHGVKHAYGATSAYAPAVRRARGLVEQGLIGEVRDIEAVTHMGAPRTLAYSWPHRLDDGGGVLLNGLPHFLGQVHHLTDGVPRWVIGRADPDIDHAPEGPVLHDFRDWAPVDPESAAAGPWHEVDADLRATVVLGLETPTGHTVRAVWHVSAFTVGRHPDYLALMGTEGTLHLTGHPWPEKLEHGGGGSTEWVDVPVDDSDYAADPVQYGWDRLTADFLDHLEGRGSTRYPTFHDGLVVNRVIDEVRGSTTDRSSSEAGQLRRP